MKYTGYWLYNEQLELWHPEKQRLKRDGNRVILTGEDLKRALQRIEEQEALRIAKAKESSSKTR